MPFIDTIAPGEARGEVQAMYRRQQDHWGYVPNYARVFCHRPEVLARWGRLLAEIRRPMSDRRFEIATFAAAHELRNTACALAHGRNLADLAGIETVEAVAGNAPGGSLNAAETAIAAFARKVARDATDIDVRDVEALKAHGLSDAEVFDVAAAAAGRAFFTKLLDALGVLADRPLERADAKLRAIAAIGRPVAGTEPDTVAAG